MTRRRRRRGLAPESAEVLECRKLLTIGTLDTSFAGTGLFTGTGFGSGLDVEVQSDGKILMAIGGSGVSGGIIVRFNDDGSPDLFFGAQGAVAFNGSVGDLELMSDGSILVATLQGTDSFVSRVTPDGLVDNTFGTGGVLATGSGIMIPEIAVDSLDRFITLSPDDDTGPGVVPGSVSRFNADGTPDLTFGTSGTLELSGIEVLADIEFDANENIVIASQELYRLDPSGQLDTSFSGDGIAQGTGQYYDLDIAPDGTIYAVGNALTVSEGQVAAFDASGNELATATYADNLLSAVAVDDDGNVVVGSGNYFVPEGDAVVVRYDSALNLDTNFGAVTVGTNMSIKDLEIDASGRAVGGGFGESNAFFITRVIAVNDIPVANDDTADITEDAAPGTVGGNVLDNDTDLGLLTVSEVNGTTSVGLSVTTAYGSIVINPDGSYVYTLDNSNPTVQDLDDGEILTDTIAYTIVDDAGASATANLDITIHGANDATTPSDQLDDLVNEVTSLVEDGDLPEWAGASLTSTLDRVQQALDRGQTALARAYVQVFRNQVVLLYIFRQISLTDAQNLFGLGTNLLNSL